MNEWRPAEPVQNVIYTEIGDFYDRAVLAVYPSGSIQLCCRVIVGRTCVDSITYYRTVEDAHEAADSVRAKVRALARELAALDDSYRDAMEGRR